VAEHAVLQATPVRTRRGRRVALLVGGLLVLVLLAIAGPSIYVANELTGRSGAAFDSSLAPTIGPRWDDVSFPSREQTILLQGWLFHAANGNGRSVIMVHGLNQNRIDKNYSTNLVAHDLLAQGYDVLLFDQRACGESGGDRFTIANKEYLDVLGAYDYMKSGASGTTYNPHQMAVIGDSMGGASLLRAAGQMGDVGALVVDSTFAELHPLLAAQLPKRSPLPAFYTEPSLLAGRLFGLVPDLRPIDNVRALPQRAFLFFHGLADDFVPPSNSQALRAASANPDSDLVLVPGAKHVQTYKVGPAAYIARVLQFFDKEMQ
jgi:fermentation-respiration switch protein FrsA (DUF1100 family)